MQWQQLSDALLIDVPTRICYEKIVKPIVTDPSLFTFLLVYVVYDCFITKLECNHHHNIETRLRLYLICPTTTKKTRRHPFSLKCPDFLIAIGEENLCLPSYHSTASLDTSHDTFPAKSRCFIKEQNWPIS